MIKAITKLWMTLLLLCVAGVANAATEYEIDQKFTSIAELDGISFAIVDETPTTPTAMGIGIPGHGNGWDMYFGTITEAYNSNACYYKLEAVQTEGLEGYYYLRTFKNDGTMYTAWGNTENMGFFNSQTADQSVCFALGLEGRNGQDGLNLAVWAIEVSEGKFALKNIGTGLYLHGDNLPAKYEDPFYFTFCTLKAGGETPDPVIEEPVAPLADGEIIPDFFSICDEGAIPYGYAVNFNGENRAYPNTYGGGARIFAFGEGGDFVRGLYFREGYVQYGDVKKLALEANKKYIVHFNSAMWKSSGAEMTFLIYKEGDLENAVLTQTIANTPDVNGSKDAVTGSTYSEIEFTPDADGNYILKWDASGWREVLLANPGVKVAASATVETVATFDFNASNHATSNNGNEGDITADEVNTVDGVTMTITPNPSGTPNRYWSTNNGPQLRMYGGKMTLVAPEGKAITKVEINQGKWNAGNAFNGEVAATSTWEGNSTNVILEVAGNTQMNSVAVTIADANGETTTYTIPSIANTAETAYTVAEAIEKIEAGVALSDVVFVKGIVSQVDDFADGTITYWISDDGTTANQFECYKGKGIDGADFAAIEDVEVGAEVIVTGTMKKYTPSEGDPIYEFNAGNALVSYNVPVKPLFAEGTYYLYNVAVGQYMAAGSSWGTHAVTNAVGLDYTLAFTDGKYTIDSQVSNGGDKHFLNGEWNDGLAMGWIFAPVEGAEGVYTISDGTKFMTAQGENGEVLLQEDATAAAAQWILKTKEDRLAEIAAANAEAPVDATFLISANNFGRNDLRNKIAWTGDDFNVGGDNTNMNAEKWGGNSQLFDVHQKINLPNGIYRLTWNGYYRYNNTTENTNDVAATAHAEGTEVINSYVYANETSIALTSIADEDAYAAFGNKMPFSQGDASAAFGQGLYEQSADLIIDADTLVIGVRKIEHLGTDWTVWDNFRLTYYGVAVNPDKEEIAVPEGMVNLIANGNLAGDDVTSFVAKEYPSADILPARIVAGAGENNSRGIVVKAGDDTENAEPWAWDSQFWISFNQALSAGAKLHVEFDYAASKAAKGSTQAHGEPGAYQHWAAIGDVNFTTEWQHFSADVEVSGDMAGANGMKSIAFNLQEEKTATDYYFDNFGVWAELPAPVENWTDIVVNGDMEGADMINFFVTEQGVGGPFVATATEAIGKDGSKAVKVQSADSPANDWDTQFFIRLPYQLPAGTKYKVSFDYKADKEGAFDTQAHANPGQYIHWAFCGSGNFTTEWQTYTAEGLVPSECDGSSAQKTFQTIAFNLAKNGVATEFIFDNVKFEVPSDIVETLVLNPYCADDAAELQAPEGWTKAITNGNLAGEDVASFVSKEYPSIDIVPATIVPGAGKDYSRGIVVKAGDDTANEAAVAWDSQFWIKLNEKLPEGSKVHIEFDYKASLAAKATTQAHSNPGDYLHWAMMGDVNFTTEWQHFSADVDVTAAMAKGDNGNGNGDGLFSIAFNLQEEKAAVDYYFDNFGVWYQLPETVGIQTVKNEKNAEGVFNLNGQKVMKTQKGLYIMNGKKVVIK